jgi:hypothetical protein
MAALSCNNKNTFYRNHKSYKGHSLLIKGER